MPSPGLGGSLQIAYVPVPEAKPFILFQWWAREVFFFCLDFMGFFLHEHMLVSPSSPPPLHLQTCCSHYTDNLLAVIYGLAQRGAHRLENFQFTQEFPEK